MTAVAAVQGPQPFDVDFDEVFGKVSADIASVRQSRGLDPLVPDGAVLVGKEHLPVQQRAPRIVIVPMGATYEPARRVGKQVSPGLVNANPAVFWLQWLKFYAYCWGPDAPQKSAKTTLYGFSTSLELARELMGALARNLGGVPNIRLEPAEFDQPRDIMKSGRLYVLGFAIGTSVTDEPWTIAEPVSGDVTVSETSPDGSQNVVQMRFGAP